MVRTALQLITVRNLDEPFDDTLDRIADAGYDGVQLRGRMAERLDMEPAALGESVRARGLEIVAPFVYDFEEGFEETLSTLEVYGASAACCGYSAEHFESADAVDATASELDRTARRLSEHGIDLCCHNHDHEFVALGSGTAYDRLIDRTERTKFVLDVGWAYAAGADPVALLERIADRTPLIHMKDYDRDRDEIVELGEGGVDLAECAHVACQRGTEWLVYEHDDPDDPAGAINRGAAFLDSL